MIIEISYSYVRLCVSHTVLWNIILHFGAFMSLTSFLLRPLQVLVRHGLISDAFQTANSKRLHFICIKHLYTVVALVVFIQYDVFNSHSF